MQVKLIFLGKTRERYIAEGISVYEDRLKRYFTFTMITLVEQRSFKNSDQIVKIISNEAKIILKNIKVTDYVVLLDEKGMEFTSKEFSGQMQKFMNTVKSNLVFIIGGAYGFDQTVYERADFILSLSKLTFSHQMVRLFFVEQLYRSMTILNHEPYHH